MKLAVFSDIHSNYLVFTKAYQDALNKGVDSFLFLGDYVTDGFDGNKIIDIIKTTKSYAIIGNREEWVINYSHNGNLEGKYLQFKSMLMGYKLLRKDNLAYLNTLPKYQIVNIENKKIFMSHASPYGMTSKIDENSYEEFDKMIKDYDCDIYLFGHSHIYFDVTYKNKKFINPGSIGLPIDGNTFKYAIVEINNNINCTQVNINYEYNKLEEYYKNNDYYNEVNVWTDLLLLIMKTGEDHTRKFVSFVKDNALKNGYVKNGPIPDSIFSIYGRKYLDTFININ